MAVLPLYSRYRLKSKYLRVYTLIRVGACYGVRGDLAGGELVTALIGSCLQCQPHACALADAAQWLAVDRDFFLAGLRGQREPRFGVRWDADFEMQVAVRFFP